MFIAVIPARLHSSRFPAKVLANILGKSLLQRTFEQASQVSGLSRVVVATDDRRVYDHVLNFGGEVVMTSVDCCSGSERVAEAADKYFLDADYIINIQADEPLLDPAIVEQLMHAHLQREQAELLTPVQRLEDRTLIESQSVVKCVFDLNYRALYFSRSVIPYAQKKQAVYYRHLGVYSFTRHFLLQYAKLGKTHLQEAEDLEQLKALEWGVPIYVAPVEGNLGIEVNYPEDIAKVEKYLCKESISLSQVASSPL